MRPVRTAKTPHLVVGPGDDDAVGDLPCQFLGTAADPTTVIAIRSVWALDPDERAAIAAGANVQVIIYGAPMPPVSLEVVDEPGVTPDRTDVVRLLRQAPR